MQTAHIYEKHKQNTASSFMKGKEAEEVELEVRDFSVNIMRTHKHTNTSFLSHPPTTPNRGCVTRSDWLELHEPDLS